MKHILFVIFLVHCLGKIILSQNSYLQDKRLRHHWGNNGRSFERRQALETKNGNSHIPEAFKEAIVFPDETTMLKMGGDAKIGAIAYVEDGKFFGKSSRGWTPFMMGTPIRDIQENGHTPRIEAVIPPTLITKISESKVKNVNIPEKNFENHILRNKNGNNISSIYGTLKLVALNKPSTGNLGGIKSANFKCQKEAIKAGQDGVYRAFLASKSLNLAEILNPQISFHFTIINIKGNKLFDSYDSLRNHTKIWPMKQHVLITPIYSFDQRNVIFDEHWPINMVWHGPAKNGYVSANDSDCNEWTSSSSSDIGLASDYLTKGLFHNQKENCDNKLIVLCIEIGCKNNNTQLSLEEHVTLLHKYEAEYVKDKNGGDGESSSSQSDSNYDEDHTGNSDSIDPEPEYFKQ